MRSRFTAESGCSRTASLNSSRKIAAAVSRRRVPTGIEPRACIAGRSNSSPSAKTARGRGGIDGGSSCAIAGLRGAAAGSDFIIDLSRTNPTNARQPNPTVFQFWPSQAMALSRSVGGASGATMAG